MPPESSDPVRRTFEIRFPEIEPDYLQRTLELLQSRGYTCIKQRWIIYYLRSDGSRLCRLCAEENPPHQLFIIKNYHVFVRRQIFDYSEKTSLKYHCNNCGIRLAELRPIRDCEDCLDNVLSKLASGKPLYAIKRGRTSKTIYQSYAPLSPTLEGE